MSSRALSRRYPRPRLLYAATALLILILLTTNAGLILHLRETETRDEETQLKYISLMLEEQADRAFESVDRVVSSIGDGVATEGVADQASFVAKMVGPEIHRLLQEKISGVAQLEAVSVMSRDGKLINSSRSWPLPEIDITDRDYFRALKENPSLKTYISVPLENRLTGTWTIFLAHRVSGVNGEFRGIVLGAIEMRYFEDFFQAVSLGNGTSIVILRSDGVMLARVPRTDAIGKTFSSVNRLMRGGVSELAHELSPIDGSMRIIAAHRLTNYPVFALATKTEDAALTEWRSIAWLMSLGAAGCALSIAIAGYAFGRHWKQQAMLAEAQADAADAEESRLATEAELQRHRERAVAELRLEEDRTAAFEAMRTAKVAAEMADRAKSEFLSTMSHELRTPLNAVLGLSEMMASEMLGPLGNENYRGYAQEIHASGSHLLGIITDILDLSKATSGKLELFEGWVDAREIVDYVCLLFGPRAAAAKLSLSVNMPPGNLITYADERLLKQILLNLLSNACKFTEPQGHIECSASVDALGLTLSVTDTGIGIPAENLERVQQPFVQGDGSLSRRHQGAGLGLALVKAMAELHGGLLRLTSEVGRGTTAAVILPLSQVDPASADVPPDNGSSSRADNRLIA
jgi:signal transduction histidine kinase